MSQVPWSDLKKRAEDATKPPEPDWYVLECTKAEAGVAATSGNPMLKTQWKIVEGPSAGKSGIFNNFNITPDSDFALSIFFRHMEALGLGDEFFARNPTTAQVAEALVGRRGNVKLGIRTFQGVDRPNFEDIKALDGIPNAGAVPVGGPPVPAGAAVPTVPTVPSVGAGPAVGDGPPALPAF